MVLDGNSLWRDHAIQNIALVLLSLIFLPLDLIILGLSYARSLTGRSSLAGVQTSKNPRTILVTGVGMTKGLFLARQFYIAGHRVIGADFETSGIPSPGRFSYSSDKFYGLQKPSPKVGGSAPYIQGLLDVILKEKVDIWVSCSGVASAVEDGEAKEIVEKRTKCRAIQFDVTDTQTLHEKNTFIERTEEIGLNVPETHTITNRAAVEEALRNAPPGRTYLLKTIGMDDANRGGVLLPKKSDSETSASLSNIEKSISKENPWIMQQFVHGEEFCTHSLIVRGKVKAFLACPSSELLMHYAALPADSALSKAMLKFTDTYAAKSGKDFTGHLSFDFLVEDTTPTIPEKIVLYPIECNPRAHTAVCLFSGTPELVDGYLDLLDESTDNKMKPIVTPIRTDRYYWIGHDLVEFVLAPVIGLIRGQAFFSELLDGLRSFAAHILSWRDGTYEVWDPLPWFALYHLYWPLQFLHCLSSGKKWSRLNVSTLKMFEC
ncbi:hypothetical protein HII31_01341 [Pseudocercospora fuligena]|uniref:ATP-grasp domain-containing protein n=1 Tax=Pseudocercospora fuligena TaxID=685502 RepID=A0A8H6VMJ0_9PEZI|nr:hypothetical protein HII31_01341 [Pseudocercospora fuligena]